MRTAAEKFNAIKRADVVIYFTVAKDREGSRVELEEGLKFELDLLIRAWYADPVLDPPLNILFLPASERAL
jgi:hypothetical protein